MLSENQIAQLRAPFPIEALSADISRGFELTSIKAAFIVERLNEVFGLCGCGWRYAHSPFEFAEGEVLTEVALQFRVNDGGCDPVIWDTQTRNWAFAPDSGAWSYPIIAPGGRRPGKGTAPLTDARKGAITDGLTKAASMIGVGQDVFKGLVRTGQPAQKAPERAPAPHVAQHPVNGSKAPQNGCTPPFQTNGSAPTPEQPKPAASANGKAANGATVSSSAPKSNGPATANATSFWLKANRYTDKLDRAKVSGLAKQVVTGSMSWIEAQSQLDDLIDAATLPTFGQASPEPAAEQTTDPLDDLFE